MPTPCPVNPTPAPNPVVDKYGGSYIHFIIMMRCWRLITIGFQEMEYHYGNTQSSVKKYIPPCVVG
jgi:hypothetical protein